MMGNDTLVMQTMLTQAQQPNHSLHANPILSKTSTHPYTYGYKQ